MHLLHIQAWASALPSDSNRQCEKPSVVGRQQIQIPTLPAFKPTTNANERMTAADKLFLIMKIKISALLLFVVFTNCVATAETTINDIRIRHEIRSNNQYGMAIDISFNIDGAKGENCDVILMFYNKVNGAKLMKYSSGYSTSSNNLCASRKFIPSYDNSTFNNFEIFIPYSAFELPNNPYELEFKVYIRKISNNKTLAVSSKKPFTLIKLDYNCYGCGGDGICSACYGNGGYSTYGYRNWNVCYRCHGRKYCTTCGGNKTLSQSKSLDYSYISSSTTPSYNSGYNAGNNIDIKTTRTQCRVCNGTGKKKVYISNSIHNDTKYYCSECGETDLVKHIHQSCSACYGNGYIESSEAVVR